ncbi:MAG: hypothetical protein WBA43_22905 [Elainellaceae cyanobacterium]
MQILEQTPQRLVIRYDPVHRWLMAIGAIVYIFVAGVSGSAAARAIYALFLLSFALILLLWRGDQVTCVFDKQKGRLTYQRSGLRGTNTTVVPLPTVSHITLQERRYRKRSWREGRVYWVYLELRSSRERLTLSSDTFFNLEKAQNAAWLVSDFLGLPPFSFVEAPPLSLFSFR